MTKNSQAIPLKIQKIFIACAGIFVATQIGFQIYIITRWADFNEGGLVSLAMIGTFLFLVIGLFCIPYVLLRGKTRVNRLFLTSLLATSAGLLFTSVDSLLTPFIYWGIYSSGNSVIISQYFYEMGKAVAYLAVYSLVLIKFRKTINS